MKINKRAFLCSLTVAGLAAACPALGQSGPLRIVIPLTPGTTPDSISRAISPLLQERLKTPIVVENKPGASGMIGMGSVAQAADANTLMMVPATTLTLPFFYRNVDFDVLRTFTPITHVASSSFVLAVGNQVPANNLAEFSAWVRANRGAFYASPGNGTHHHLFMELLLQSLGLKLSHVPYRGSAPALNDLMGGQVPTMFLPIQVAVPLRNAGRLKIIGGSLRERHPNFPDIPSLHELGAKDFHADPWYAVWGSPKITSEQAEKYRQAIISALNAPELKDNLVGKQGLIIKTSTPAELQRMAQAESDMWRRVIQTAQIKPE